MNYMLSQLCSGFVPEQLLTMLYLFYCFQKFVSILFSILEYCFCCSLVYANLTSRFSPPISEAFTEDDWKLVQLVLTLFRNILAIQDISLQQKSGGSASEFLSLRDRFMELLFKENVMDLILVLTQHIGGSCGYFRQDNLLLLETFHYIFMGQDPELIAKAHMKGSKVFFFGFIFLLT